MQEDVDSNGNLAIVRRGSREALVDLWKEEEIKLNRQIRDRFCKIP